jgi:hypothetical protein
MVGIMTYLIYINSSNIMFIMPFLLIIILTITIGFFNFYDNKNNLDSKFNNKINL